MKKEKEKEGGDLMEKIVSLCKRRGFIFQGSEIYGGLAGTYDYGPLGLALKKNIENLWWKQFVDSREDMYGIDSAILMNPMVWEASGHVSGFSDPLVECKKCKKRFRTDHLKDIKKCPECKGELGDSKQFNMMFKTHVGATGDESSISYLRPETAQGMFVNFKNIIDSFHPKLPFGIAQIGRTFRNEIAPRDFIFRVRELEIMELEYFFEEKNWQEKFDYWIEETRKWFKSLGFAESDIKEIEIGDGDRAHYSKRTVDFHFNFPGGFDEIGGLAYRTDFDLKSHIDKSGSDLHYLDPNTNVKFIPHVLEPTFGLGRHVLAVISKAYTEDELGGEKRNFLKFPVNLAPIKVAVFPLLKNKPDLVEKAREIYKVLKQEFGGIVFDDNGNIGKRYRRQDEIGTPFCVTVDFETIENNAGVTIRDRDTGKQERIKIEELKDYIKEKIN
jgi:glycyl-tRNA synthetase